MVEQTNKGKPQSDVEVRRIGGVSHGGAGRRNLIGISVAFDPNSPAPDPDKLLESVEQIRQNVRGKKGGSFRR